MHNYKQSMNTETIKQYLPVAKQALQVNAVLALYFLMPNFTSFALTALLAVVLFVPDQVKGECCGEECCSLNQLFQEYLAFNFTRKLMTVVFIGVAAQLAYLLPSWLIIFLAAQCFAFKELLINFGAMELLGAFMSNTESAISKFMSLIPRYEE